MKNEELELEEEMEEEQPNEKKENPKKNVSTHFSNVIKNYLDKYALEDPTFKERYENPDKNINECCNYIINTVRESGCNGFADEEIYKIARDYYVDEIDKAKLKSSSCKVVVNHTIELTEEEKQQAHDRAIKDYENEVKRKLEEQAKKKAEKEERARIKAEELKAKKEAEKKEEEDFSLFDLLEG